MPIGYKEFSSQIKQQYPQYKDMDDKVLAERMIEKYPVYKDQVTFDDAPVVAAAKPQQTTKEEPARPKGNPDAQPQPQNKLAELSSGPIAGGFGDVMQQTQQVAEKAKKPRPSVVMPTEARAKRTQQEIPIQTAPVVDEKIQRQGKILDAMRRIDRDTNTDFSDPGFIIGEYVQNNYEDPSMLVRDDTEKERLRVYSNALDYHRNILESDRKLVQELGFDEQAKQLESLNERLQASQNPQEQQQIQSQIAQIVSSPEFATGYRLMEQMQQRQERMKEYSESYVAPLMQKAIQDQVATDFLYATNPIAYEVAKPAIDLVAGMVKGAVAMTTGRSAIYDAIDDGFEAFIPTSSTLPSEMKKPVFGEGETNYGRILPAVYGTVVRMVPTFAGAAAGTAIAGPVGGAVGASAMTFEAVYDDFFKEAIRDPAFTNEDAMMFAAIQAGKTALIEQIGGVEQKLAAKMLGKGVVEGSIQQYKNDILRGISKPEAMRRASRAIYKDIGSELKEENIDLFSGSAINGIANYMTGGSLETNVSANEFAETQLLTVLTAGLFSGARVAGQGPSELMKHAYIELAKNNEMENLGRLIDRAVAKGEMTRDQASVIKYNAEGYRRAIEKLPANTTDEQMMRIVPKVMQIEEIKASVPKDAPLVFKEQAKQQIAEVEQQITNEIAPEQTEQMAIKNTSYEAKVGGLIDAPEVVVLDGRRGTLTLDGQRVIWQEMGTNKEIDMGNVDEVKDSSIEALGGVLEQSEVSFDFETNMITVRGEKYNNNFSDPVMAINRDSDGNVVSVNLETPNGQKRTFRGQVAEDIAYEITLKKISENEQQRAEFEEFINTDEQARTEMESARSQAAALSVEGEADVEVPGVETATPAAVEGAPATPAAPVTIEATEVRRDAENVVLLDAEGKVLSMLPTQQVEDLNDAGVHKALVKAANDIINPPKKKRKTIEELRAERDARSEKEIEEKRKQKELLDSIERGTAVTGLKATDMRSLMLINQKLFGLGKLKALYSAVIMDRMVGVMARRAGISKKDLYSRIEFRKKPEGVENDVEYIREMAAAGVPVTYQMQMPDGSTATVRNMGADVVNGFYSPIEKALGEISQEKGTAAQFKALIKKAKGVKADELEYTGVEAWLDSLGDEKITKAQIADFMRDNRIQIVEVVQQEVQAVDGNIEIWENWARENNPSAKNISVVRKSSAATQHQYDVIVDGEKVVSGGGSQVPFVYGTTGTQYSEYTVPGEKSDYKEILITMPSRMSLNQLRDFYNSTTQGQRPFDELTKAEFDDLMSKYLKGKEYNSSHFKEPNIVAHLRADIRTDADGNRVLFVNEIQSDWAQDGRKYGFRDPDEQAKYLAAREYRNAIYLPFKNGDITGKEADALADALAHRTGFSRLDIHNAAAKYGDFTLTPESMDDVPAAPFVTKTEGWVNLALKTALKHAVASGATRIAFANGEQLSDLYKLSNQVDELNVRKDDNGMYVVDGWKNGTPLGGKSNIPEKELGDYIGKDLAQKVIAEGKSDVTFRGDDLEIKAPGMAKFYGSAEKGESGIIPTQASKLFGQKPQAIEINGVKQFAVEITPEMKAQATEGQPLFQIAGENANLSQTVRDNLRVARDMEASGKDVKSIRLATGWERGADKKWRYEIFSKAPFKVKLNLKLNQPKVKLKSGNEATYHSEKLGDIIRFPQIFKAYPSLKNIRVNMYIGENNGLRGEFRADGDVRPGIDVFAENEDLALSLLLHEMQHAIQSIEGFSSGTNVGLKSLTAGIVPLKYIMEFERTNKEYADLLEKDEAGTLTDIDRERMGELASAFREDYFKKNPAETGYERYRKTAGEVEARNVQSRMSMTPKQRMQTTLQETEDVARESQTLFQDAAAMPSSKAQGAALLAADGSAIVYALTDPNVSTPIHEMAHVFEHYLTDAERKRVLDWAKHTEWTTQTSEAFARGFEKYLADGVSPSKQLKAVFDKFRDWLTEIYDGITGTAVDLKLNKPMRELYAKMLGEKVVAEAAPSTAAASPRVRAAQKAIQNSRPSTPADERVKALYQASGTDITGQEMYQAATNLVANGFTVPEILTAMKLEYGYKFTNARRNELRKALVFGAFRDYQGPATTTVDMIDEVATELDVPFVDAEAFHKEYMEATPGMKQRQGNLRKGQYKGLESIKVATAEVANSVRTFYKTTNMEDVLDQTLEFLEANGGLEGAVAQDLIFDPKATDPIALQAAHLYRKQLSMEMTEISRRLQDPSLTPDEIGQLQAARSAAVRQNQRVLEAYEKKVGKGGLILAMAKVFNSYTKESLIAEIEEQLLGYTGDDKKPIQLTEDQKDRIGKLLDVLNDVDGVFHDQVIAELSQYIRGDILPQRFDMDTFIAVYYGSILSGFMTQFVNAKAGFGSIVFIPMSKLLNPQRWIDFMFGKTKESPVSYFVSNFKNFFKGMKEGWPALVDVVKNGSHNNKYFSEIVKPGSALSMNPLEVKQRIEDGFLFFAKKETGGYRFNLLRRFGFKAFGKHFSLNPYSYLKYVTRGISAVDTLVTATAYEMRIRETIMHNYANGNLNPDDYQQVNTMLDNLLTQEQSDKINSQLDAERLALQTAGIDVSPQKIRRRRRELILSQMNTKLMQGIKEEAAEMARTDAFTNEVRGNSVIGYFARAVVGSAQAIERTTKSKMAGAMVEILRVRLIPFVNTLANVQDMALDYMPIYGPIRATWKYGARMGSEYSERNKNKPKDAPERKTSATNMAQRDRGWFGTVVFMGLVMMNALRDDDDEEENGPWLTGSKPGLRWDEKRSEEVEIPSNSVRIFGKYFNYSAIPGLGIPMAIIGNANDMERSGRYAAKDIYSYFAAAASSTYGFWTQMGFMESVRNTFNAIDNVLGLGDEEKMRSRIDVRLSEAMKGVVREGFGMVASTLPNNFNVFKQSAKLFDPMSYTRNDWDDELAYQIGIARFANKPALDIFGDVVESYPGEMNTPYPKNFGLKEVSEELKWMIYTAKVGTPRQVNRHRLYAIGEDIRELTDDEYYDLCRLKGQFFKEEIQFLMEDYDEEYQNYEVVNGLPKRKIESLIIKANQAALEEAMYEMNIFDDAIDSEEWLESQGLPAY